MKASDYIVDYLIEKEITDVFGYPGGLVANLVDSFHKRGNEISTHVTYHEQGAVFAACAYAQISGKPGVVYATGGPGATNLITGIGHAYYDSIPLICFTGNVNTYEAKGNLKVRQRAFQESDIISVVKSLTKYCVYMNDLNKLPQCLTEAYEHATTGRNGPVLIDLPMDVLRGDIVDESYNEKKSKNEDSVKHKEFIGILTESLKTAKRPCFLFGQSAKMYCLHISENKSIFDDIINKYKIPYVTSMLAFDISVNNPYYYGFVGSYGDRTANFVIAKSDLVIAIGSRMDIRQVGLRRSNFAPNAKIIRVDIDEGELEYKVHDDEISFLMDISNVFDVLQCLNPICEYAQWVEVCNSIRNKLKGNDYQKSNEYVKEISSLIRENTVITTDVGQNQVWVPQSFIVKNSQTFLFSGGFGAMGHALPAAIGAYYGASGKKNVVCICGDGGFQMNIQELQFIARENLPIKIIVFNNYALGMIRHFQEMYFDSNYYDTTAEGGYTTPDFVKVANAYGIDAVAVYDISDVDKCREMFINDTPALIEICINENTYVFPKLEFGKPNQDQEPLIDRELYDELMNI